MPRVVVECECCHTTKAYMGEDWEMVCRQVAGEWVWPLCRACFLGYERSLTETAQIRASQVNVREVLSRWV